MSTTILKIISTNPSFIPKENKIAQSTKFLLSFYKKEQIESTISDSIVFVDPGENFDSVFCNECNSEIDITFWQEAMDKAYEMKFNDLSFNSPCCNKHTSLNDLIYKENAGFAKFIISVSESEKNINDEDIKRLEDILETRIKIILTHY